jgi:predicted RNase H-like HicB family nuclease
MICAGAQGEQSGYVAECIDLLVVSQGESNDSALKNVREALELHLESEDTESLGISTTAPILTMLQLAPRGRKSSLCFRDSGLKSSAGTEVTSNFADLKRA